MKYNLLALLLITPASAMSLHAEDSDKTEEKLIHFREINFGVNFKHSSLLKTRYNPHGSADRVLLSYRDTPIGGLVITPRPKDLKIDQFIEAGKQMYKKKYKATSVKYTKFKTKTGYEFHCIEAKATIKGNKCRIERFVHIREKETQSAETDEADQFIKNLSGVLSFEFVMTEDNYESTKKETRKVLNSFDLKEASESQGDPQ